MESLRTLAFGCTFPPRDLIPAVFKSKNLLIARFSFEVLGNQRRAPWLRSPATQRQVWAQPGVRGWLGWSREGI